jgi:hypothetical protein
MKIHLVKHANQVKLCNTFLHKTMQGAKNAKEDNLKNALNKACVQGGSVFSVSSTVALAKVWCSPEHKGNLEMRK